MSFFQKFEEELLDKLTEDGVNIFSIKEKHRASWNREEAAKRLVQCVEETEYGYDMKIKIPTIYETKKNRFRVFDEDGKELDEHQIQDRLYGDNGKNQEMSLLLQVSSVSIYVSTSSAGLHLNWCKPV